MSQDVVPKDEIRAALAARQELGDDMEPAVFAGFPGIVAVCVALAVIAIVSSR